MKDYVSLDLENTNLWKAFAKKADDKQRTMVKDVCNHAASLLDLIRDTFPTYTLHNRIHAINVINLMGELLNDHLQDLSALEGAILILSAYLHDVGMVFTDEERKQLDSAPEFKRFLREHPEASLMLESSKGISEEIAEWFCRWIHPDRVFNFFKNTGDIIKWGIIPISDKLGYVCQSHGYDSVELIDDNKFPTDYLGDADLKFCAVILRIADILDFDNSRSPDEVYNYLGIKKQKNTREKNSDTEWKKHLASQGFIFKLINDNIVLKLIASPNHPAVEYDVRQFLDIIEIELQKCNGVLKHCSDRWRNFPLPISIDRNDIHSNGYKYGEYRFTLDQQKVPELLMGENLYSDPFVFVRELLQNAIDTTRHRSFFEKNKNNINFTPKPIEVSSWLDEQGYQWIRIDDYGMGMTEEIIKNYFLKVGESYYQSSAFRASIIAARKSGSQDFVPISRFGIGVLSCFITCDRIEVSTRHIESQLGGIRLSLSGLHSFYVLQSEKDQHYDATPMPSSQSTENSSYRKKEDFGTSISVRLNPYKEKGALELNKVIEKHILCSPVPVICNSKILGGNYEALVCNPWIKEIVESELTKEEISQLEKVFRVKLSSVKIRLTPLNLTKASPDQNLKGQGLIGSLILPKKDREKIKNRQNMALKYSHQSSFHSVYGRRYSDTTTENFSFEFVFTNTTPLIVASFGFRKNRLIKEEEDIKIEIDKIQTSKSKSPKKQSKTTVNKLIQRLSFIQNCSDYDEREAVIDVSRILENINSNLGIISGYAIQKSGRQNRSQVAERLISQSIGYGRNSEETKVISHNGIAIPNQNLDLVLEIKKQKWIRILIALHDALRPDFSLSRENVRHLTWDVCSNLCYSFYLALQEARFTQSEIDLVIGSSVIEKDLSLGRILIDPLVKNNLWSKQKIIRIINSDVFFSVDDLIKKVSTGEEVFLAVPSYYDFIGLCSGALIQTQLNVTLVKRKARGFAVRKNLLRVNMDEAAPIYEGQKLFSPLLFVAFENNDILTQIEGFGKSLYNLNHSFSIWLIKNSIEIHQKYPGIFSEIKRHLEDKDIVEFPFDKTASAQEWILSINEVIKRLKKLDRNLVTEEAYIEESAIKIEPLKLE